jgi:hypothetical protein
MPLGNWGGYLTDLYRVLAQAKCVQKKPALPFFRAGLTFKKVW